MSLDQRKKEQAALTAAALQSDLSKTLMSRQNAFLKVVGTVVTLKCGATAEASFVDGEILLLGFPLTRVLEIDALLTARTRFTRYKGVALQFCRDNKVRVGRGAAVPPSEALVNLLSL